MLRVAVVAIALALPWSLAAAPAPGHGSFTVLSQVPASRKVVALTVDLGESATRASLTALLDYLKAHKLRATFFVTGWFVRTFPDLARRLVADGHQLGNHTDTHPHCRKISSAALREQMRNVEELLRRNGLSVNEPRYFRPPFGEYNQRVADTARELGYRTVMWSATALDYNKQGDADRLARSVVRRIHPGGIILTHATPVSARMVPQVVAALQAQGYTVLTLDELVEQAQTGKRR